MTSVFPSHRSASHKLSRCRMQYSTSSSSSVWKENVGKLERVKCRMFGGRTTKQSSNRDRPTDQLLAFWRHSSVGFHSGNRFRAVRMKSQWLLVALMTLSCWCVLKQSLIHSLIRIGLSAVKDYVNIQRNLQKKALVNMAKYSQLWVMLSLRLLSTSKDQGH